MKPLITFCLSLLACVMSVSLYAVPLKEIARVEGVRDNPVIGYGLVVGLAGTGDSPRSAATVQSVANALKAFGVSVDEQNLYSRNVAAVIVTASLSPFLAIGSKMDVNVSSMGDSRSLVGGTLLMTPLKAANGKVYALAQGQISVGGFSYDQSGNVVQKNHTTVGIIPDGATVEKETESTIAANGKISIVLNEPDFTTAERIATAINERNPGLRAEAVHPGKVTLNAPSTISPVRLVTELESLKINQAQRAIVVINERTGTVVSGGDVKLDDVTISHDNLRVVISNEYRVSQPSFVRQTPGVATVVVPDTDISVSEGQARAVGLPSGTSIADLITALRQIKTSTRDVITILQSIKAAGALNARLVIQ